MLQVKDIHYLAGLWDGEGTFFVGRKDQKYPRITAAIKMTDLYPVQRTKELLNSNVKIREYTRSPSKNCDRKNAYVLTLSGKHAIGFMQTIYPLMSPRRQERIRECIAAYKEMPGNKRDVETGRFV